MNILHDVIYFCDQSCIFSISFQCHMIFRNHNNMLICCLRNIIIIIYYYYVENRFFQVSLMNKVH